MRLKRNISKKTEGYRNLIKQLQQSEVRLRRTKSGARTIKQNGLKEAVQFIFPPPLDDFDEVQRDIHSAKGLDTESACLLEPELHNENNNNDNNDNNINNNHFVEPVRSVFRTRPDEEETKQQRQHQHQQQRIIRPKSAIPRRPNGQQRNRATRTRPASAAAVPRAPISKQFQPPQNAKVVHSPRSSSSPRRPRPSTAVRVTATATNGRRMNQRQQRPKSATVRNNIIKRNVENKAKVKQNDKAFQYKLEKQRLSRYSLQNIRRTIIQNEDKTMQQQQQQQQQIQSSQRKNNSAASFVHHTKQTMQTTENNFNNTRQLHHKRILTLYKYQKKIETTHTIYNLILDDLATSRTKGFRNNVALTTGEINFLLHLRELIHSDGGAIFDWEISVFAMLQHMLTYDDPMNFSDPFVCVGIISLLTHSCVSIHKYKSWCRKNNVPLPPAENVIDALNLSKEHAFVVASTNEWLVNNEEKEQQKINLTKKETISSPNLRKHFFVTQNESLN